MTILDTAPIKYSFFRLPKSGPFIVPSFRSAGRPAFSIAIHLMINIHVKQGRIMVPLYHGGSV
jgi:hypothetical protein